MSNFPSPKYDVPLDEVGNEVQTMVWNNAVKRVEVKKQGNGKYTVTPYPS
jgi:hypothetical protein